MSKNVYKSKNVEWIKRKNNHEKKNWVKNTIEQNETSDGITES